MINEDDNDFFVNSLRGVQPIKKTNKVVKKIPQNKSFKKTEKKKENNQERIKPKIPKEEKIITKKTEIQKNHTNKKLKKGRIKIDKKIDFHGYSLDEARDFFIESINRCYDQNKRCLLYITGKGLRNKEGLHSNKKQLYFGKIRNNFINWVTNSEVSSKILNLQEAGIKYGGDGAFFVYLRKNKN